MTVLLRLPPLLLPLCFFTCGIAAAGSFGILLPSPLLYLSLLLPLPFIFIRSKALFVGAIGLTLFATGNALMIPIVQNSSPDRLSLEQNAGRPLVTEGVIVRRPEAKDGGYRVLLRPEHIVSFDAPGNSLALNGLILLRINNGGSNFYTGDRIRFQGKLKAPRNFGTAGEFDAERFYALKGIVATAFVKNDSDILLMRQGVESGLQRHFDKKAAEIGRFIMGRLPGVEGGVIKALLIGDTSDIPQQLKDAYGRTGVNHILSISGFHVGIIALALLQLWFVIARVFPTLLLHLNLRRFALAASMPLILYYMFLSGAAPATARSVLMLLFLTAGLVLERESDPINSLSLAAFALLLINPAHLHDISFQLSFLALWGIVVLTPLFCGWLPAIKSGWKHNLLLFTAASTAAVAVTLLPVAYYFQQSSLTGIISNFFIVPLLGYGAVIIGFTALPFIWLCQPLAAALFGIAGLLTAASNRLITLFDRIPLLPLFIPTPTEITIFLLALLGITTVRSSRAKSALLLAVLIIIPAHRQIPAERGDFSLRIDFLSVGQGESSLITFSDGERMLIDGGGALHDGGWDIGRQLLLPTLRRMGIKRIDYLVLTHPHPDHLQGVKAVAEALEVGEFWQCGLNSGSEYFHLKEALNQRKIPIRTLDSSSAGSEISGTRINCLYPPGSRLPADDMNENSLVLHFESGRFSALFTGDIGFEAEMQLLRSRNSLHATVLKVPHHGSRHSTSDRFLAAVQPEIALIGAGYNNSFGLPAAETVAQLHAKGVKIYRTDLDGTITVKFPLQGEKPVISAFRRQIH